LLLSLTFANSSENKILFKVNNEIITSLDILNELQYLRAINKEFKNIKKEEAFQISKNSLIREKIKEIEIKRYLKEIKDQRIKFRTIFY
jgi:peptidyl-prolyl cis-trans isomerase SurA